MLFATNYPMTELAHSELKYGLFGRVVSCHGRTDQNCHSSSTKCAPRTRTQALRRRRACRVSCRRKATDGVVFWMRRVAVLLKHKKTHPGTTCAYVAVASEQEGCSESIPFHFDRNKNAQFFLRHGVHTT